MTTVRVTQAKRLISRTLAQIELVKTDEQEDTKLSTTGIAEGFRFVSNTSPWRNYRSKTGW